LSDIYVIFITKPNNLHFLTFCQIIVVCVQEYFIKYKMRLDNNSLMKFHTFTVRNTFCLIRENNFSKHGQQFSTHYATLL